MANKASGKGKIWKTVLAVVLTIAVLCALVTGGVLIFFVTPHTMHFDSVYTEPKCIFYIYIIND